MGFLAVGAMITMLLSLDMAKGQIPSARTAISANSRSSLPLHSSCETDATVFAAYQAWHGLQTHNLFQGTPYRSIDDREIHRQIEQAKAQCIDAFVVDWYGPKADVHNSIDRTYINSVTLKLMDYAANELKLALMYDVGTLMTESTEANGSPELSITQVISDLHYAQNIYFTNKETYLWLNGKPVLFIFPYEPFDIPWRAIERKLGLSLFLISKATMQATGPDQREFVRCEDVYDGFYAWVRPTNGVWDGNDWGEEYIQNFYASSRDTTSACHDKLMVGGIWPGFHDRLAHWQIDGVRIIPRNCGETWNQLWGLAHTFEAEYLLISTFNDFEEGSDIEFGILDLSLTNSSAIRPSDPITFTASLADCKDVVYTWAFGDGADGTGSAVTHRYEKAGRYTAVVTATHAVATVTTSTTIIVSTTSWIETFTPIKPTWGQYAAQWENHGTYGRLRQTDPIAAFGKVESEVIRVNVSDYPILMIETVEVDPGASYTIQILDKSPRSITESSRITNANIIIGFTTNEPTLQWANYAQFMGWEGKQAFTLNLWIEGRAKSATIRRIAIVAPDNKRLPLIRHIYLPIITNQ